MTTPKFITLLPTLLLATAAIAATPSFTRTQLDSFFYAEGGAIADFNADANPDLAAGGKIFFGPEFKKNASYRTAHAFDKLSYSNNFLTFSDDFNQDGRPDIWV